MKALVLNPATASVTLQDLPIPRPKAGEVLIRVMAVALNPVDEIYVSRPIASQHARIIGTDFAGTVEDCHPELEVCQDKRVQKGTRVAGFLQGACSTNDRPGAFAQHITVPYDLLWVVPHAMSLEAASSVSMCGLTAAQGVFSRLGMPCPFSADGKTPATWEHNDDRSEANSPPPILNILINGASTSVGQYAAQLVQLSSQRYGIRTRLIGTASAKQHSLLSKPPYSYDVLLDYRDNDWVTKAVTATGGSGVDLALDTISEGDTVTNVQATLTPRGKFCVFRGPSGGQYDVDKLQIKPIYGAVWEGLGVEIGYNGTTLPSNPHARQFAARFFDYLSTPDIDGGIKLQPNPIRQMPGGFSRIVLDGFALMGTGSVAGRTKTNGQEGHMKPIGGEKLVYSVE